MTAHAKVASRVGGRIRGRAVARRLESASNERHDGPGQHKANKSHVLGFTGKAPCPLLHCRLILASTARGVALQSR
jgi:hypothetical protein